MPGTGRWGGSLHKPELNRQGHLDGDRFTVLVTRGIARKEADESQDFLVAAPSDAPIDAGIADRPVLANDVFGIDHPLDPLFLGLCGVVNVVVKQVDEFFLGALLGVGIDLAPDEYGHFFDAFVQSGFDQAEIVSSRILIEIAKGIDVVSEDLRPQHGCQSLSMRQGSAATKDKQGQYVANRMHGLIR